MTITVSVIIALLLTLNKAQCRYQGYHLIGLKPSLKPNLI